VFLLWLKKYDLSTMLFDILRLSLYSILHNVCPTASWLLCLWAVFAGLLGIPRVCVSSLVENIPFFYHVNWGITTEFVIDLTHRLPNTIAVALSLGCV